MFDKSKIVMRSPSSRVKDFLLYASVAVVAALLLILGNRIAGKDVAFYNGTEIGPRMEKGK
ncbi:MAG: hypothetical protein ILP09_00920 [Oscillospiraceae bacterium]|nr:hypothetical protein [Oscillospiraceae bacterium]